MAEVTGTVYEREPNGGIGERIAGAKLVFRESGSVVTTVVSDSGGSYSVDVSEGKYVVRATHESYEDFSTEPGYVVVSGNGVQTFNVFMKASDQSRPTGPTVTDFTPVSGHGDTKMTIRGTGFAQVQGDNEVVVGDEPATVVSADPTELVVLVANNAQTGPVEVTVGGRTGTGPQDFTVLPYPSPGSKADGPPIRFEGKGKPDGGGAAGAGTGSTGGGAAGAGATLSTTGTTDVLVSLVKPSDRDPNDSANARNDVDEKWSDAATYYDQASFGDLTLDYTLTSDWAELTGSYNTYVDSSANNFDTSQIDRLFAEAAQAAKADGENLDDYDAFVTMMHTDPDSTEGPRGWNMGFESNFSYNPEGINESVSDSVSTIALGEDSDWGRCAHEVGHGLVDAPDALTKSDGNKVAGEDVYQSDLIDRSVATAQRFEMMAGHNSHPLFSAFFMTQLGWYDPSNADHVRSLSWDRNPTSETFEVVAHGGSRNSNSSRCHVVELEVTSGLSYFIEVRQRPGSTSSQVFDGRIPLNGASNDGGVVVTKVLTDEVNVNQQMRFITLLHDPEVLSQGDTAVDPARDISIEITNDSVQSRPQVCEVTVEWAQDLEPSPDGKFDLNIDPWDSNYQTPDIWVDRQPYDTFDEGRDSQGRPKGNGDKPKPKQKNRFTARIGNDGSDAAQNVEATYYAVEPPGVGDNGNWAPLKTVNLGTISAGGSVDEYVDWVPVVDEHTCLKVEVGDQMGEVSFGNNQAQENIFEFTAPASSVPKAVTMATAVRNPKDEETVAFLTVRNVPEGYTVQFPHRWVWLDPKEERQFELTIVPTEDYAWYRDVHAAEMTAGITLSGSIPRHYTEPIPPGAVPPTWQDPIGGVTADVTPKREVEVELDVLERGGETVILAGIMTPAMEGEPVSVEVRDPRDRRRVAETTTDANGYFEVTIDMSEPAPGRRGEEEAEKFVEGTYRAQAYTINADNAAETNSNVVHFNLTGDPEVETDPRREPSHEILEWLDDTEEAIPDVFSLFTGNDDPVRRRR